MSITPQHGDIVTEASPDTEIDVIVNEEPNDVETKKKPKRKKTRICDSSNTENNSEIRESRRTKSRENGKRRRSRSSSRSRSRSRSRSGIKTSKNTLKNLAESQQSESNITPTQKRLRIVQEMLETEKTYITALETLKELLTPFLELKDVEEFPELEAKTIHSNGGIILEYSKLLLKMLQPRVENFTEETCISDIFLSISDYMKSMF